jgi:hypothetical protein
MEVCLPRNIIKYAANLISINKKILKDNILDRAFSDSSFLRRFDIIMRYN